MFFKFHMQIILSNLGTKFDYAFICAKLNKFFPKAELHAKGVVRCLLVSFLGFFLFLKNISMCRHNFNSQSYVVTAEHVNITKVYQS